MNLYKFARQTEREAISFYRMMAEQAETEGIKRVFDMLCADEERLLVKLEGFERHYPEIKGMESDDLRRDAIVFGALKDRPRHSGISSDLDAYRLAIEAEGRVVEQYLAAATAAADPQTSRMLRWLAALEKQELKEIERLFDFANAPNCSLEWGEFSNLDEFHNFGYYEDLRRGDLEPLD